MYRYKKHIKTTLRGNKDYEGERIEEKIARILNNQEAVADNVPVLYAEREAGVLPESNIRTDRWDVAIEAMDASSRSIRAKRAERAKTKMEAIKGGKTEDPAVSGNPK